MALDQTANFVRIGVRSSIASGDTTIGVVDADEFPDPANGNYNVVVWDTALGRPDEDPNVEIVRVTGRDTNADTLTVTRAQENTTAAAHPESSAVTLSPTAKMIGDIDTKTSGLSDDGTSLSIEDSRTKTGSAETDESVIGLYDNRSYAAAVDSNGNYYRLLRENGGSDDVLYKSQTPYDQSSFAEIKRWTGIGSTAFNRAMHVTSTGALILSSGGVIKRSTDGGQSWTDVYTLSDADNQIWGIDEDGDNLYATEYDSNVQLLTSSDDGQTWSVLADGTTFSEFDRHLHIVRVQPANDYIIVTGGDVNDVGFYRSTDGGSSWDYYSTNFGQYVGIGVHPTDGSAYYLGEDHGETGSGIVKVSDDGTNVSTKRVLDLNLQNDNQPSGPFQFATVELGNDRGAIVGTTVEDAPDTMWASGTLRGETWNQVGQVYGWRDYGSQPGPYAGILDPDVAPWLLGMEEFNSVKNIAVGAYGGHPSPPLDQASLRPNPFITTEATWSDIDIYRNFHNTTTSGDKVLCDLSDGPGTAWITAQGYYVQSVVDGFSHTIGPVTIDGTQNDHYPSKNTYISGDDAGNRKTMIQGMFPVTYEESLKVEYNYPGTNVRTTVAAFVHTHR